MSLDIRRVEYFYTTVKDQPGEGYRLLRQEEVEGNNRCSRVRCPSGCT